MALKVGQIVRRVPGFGWCGYTTAHSPDGLREKRDYHALKESLQGESDQACLSKNKKRTLYLRRMRLGMNLEGNQFISTQR
jgi:hypothetical protein